MKNRKVNESLIWDEEKNMFFDLDKNKYININDIKYINTLNNYDDFIFNKHKNIEENDEPIHIEILRGEDILRAFNYYNEIDTDKMEFSCCNFNMRSGVQNDIKPEWFNFYIKNPKYCGVITMFQGEEICGRATFFEGYNLYDNYDIIKNKYYKFYNVPYLYYGKKYENTLIDWANKNGFTYIFNTRGLIFIPFNTRVVNQYPPIDVVTVNVFDNILCSGDPQRRTKLGERRYYINDINIYDYYTAYKLKIS